MNSKPTSVDTYIDGFPTTTQAVLKQLRKLIKKTAADAEETIAYGMPAYKLNGKPLVYFAGYNQHVGFYATPTGHEKFAKELSKFKQGKGSVQFPLNEPMPLNLIERIVKFRVAESEQKAKPKKSVAPKKSIAKKANSDKASIHSDILKYNDALEGAHLEIATFLSNAITQQLTMAENKVWHGHPVWFIDGNPIVGYSVQKAGMRLMFWSGAGFDEAALEVRGAKFKDASIFLNDLADINKKDLKRWLTKSEAIQWDYKNIVKRKGKLERLK
jgi:uncharacterized protein YdhG (YjbR/CyaY superfamily)